MTRVVLGEQGGNRQHLIIALDSYEGYRYVDLRVFYRKGEEWLPTKKGITLNRERLEALLAVLADHHEEVFDFLGTAYVPMEVGTASAAQHRALEALRYHLGRVEEESVVDTRSKRIFDVETRGNVTQVILNSSHALARRLAGQSSVTELLAAYARARSDVASMPGAEPVLAQLDSLWARYCDGRGNDGVNAVEDVVPS